MADGIDVSEWQGLIDWSRVRTDFVIIRAGYGNSTSQKDRYFSYNYENCRMNGIPCGAYWYSYADSPEDAEREAAAFLEVIRGKKFEYPVYYDVEERRILSKGRAAVSEIIRRFLGVLERNGYFAGLYMSKYILDAYTENDIREKYSLWVADYDAQNPKYSMWQKSASGRIDGIEGNVDIDEANEDFPSIIRRAGLNGYGSAHTLTVIIDGETIIDNYYF